MKKLSGYLISVTFVIGALTLIGWWLDLEFLKSFANNEAMNPVTALSMIAATGSFFLLRKINAGPKGVVIARALASFVLSIAVFKLLVLTGINAGIDYWLFKDKVLAASRGPARSDLLSVVNSAYGFSVTGISLLLMNRPGKWPGIVINYLALSGFIIGVFVCIGFIYHVPEFYGILPYMAVSPATGVCFTCFSLGMLFENSEAGFMRVLSTHLLGGEIARPLIPIGVGVPLVFGYLKLSLASRITFSDALGTAALNVGIIVVFLVVLWFLAKTMNHSDAERRQAETRLEKQARLFSILPDAVVYGNKDLTINSLNPAARQIFEVTGDPAELKLDDLFKIEVPGSTREAVQRDLWGDKGFWRGESVLTTRTGKKIKAMVSVNALKNDAGEKTEWVGVYTDIGLLRLNEELELANSYLEQLAFISAHDIKSPILALNGLMDVMYHSKNLKPEDVRVLDLQKNVIGQMQLTNKALNEILRLRQNLKDISDNETLPLGEIVKQVINTLETEVRATGANLQVEMDGVSAIRFPHVYFQSLFHNLISNALKYQDPERPLVVKFTGKRIDAENIRFTIEDNGLGFDMAQNQHRLYGMFKRFHNHVPGTGIGLHIVKSIVDAFDGKIDVESTPGKGTKFVLQFNVGRLL